MNAYNAFIGSLKKLHIKIHLTLRWLLREKKARKITSDNLTLVSHPNMFISPEIILRKYQGIFISSKCIFIPQTCATMC